jgi:hypothetical protein
LIQEEIVVHLGIEFDRGEKKAIFGRPSEKKSVYNRFVLRLLIECRGREKVFVAELTCVPGAKILLHDDKRIDRNQVSVSFW